ncbi:MAG: hypothetical protein ABSC17_05540 [Thermacetogeniaceae bacterium]
MKSWSHRLKLFYILSLVALVLLFVVSYFRPLAGDRATSAIQKTQLLRTSGYWILQLQLANNDNRDVSYRVQTTLGQNRYQESILIKKDGTYIYNQPLKISAAGAGKVLVNIYREPETTPMESMTYYLSGV